MWCLNRYLNRYLNGLSPLANQIMNNYISLTDLNTLIRKTLDTQMEPSYWVVAEIGEMRQHSSGHCYMELVEKDGNHVSAKIRATVWSYTYRKLSGWFSAITGEELRAGMKILSHVEVKFHELYGLSLNIKDIDANFTLGERARRRQQVIAQLAEEGVIDMNKSLPLPLVPQQIAVISSPTAAGYGDFVDQLSTNRYGYGLQLRLFEATMQGNGAEDSIIAALMAIFDQLEGGSTSYDAVVIIRGGGAQVDLDCFDGYNLASHVAQFPLPVFTGIGHERDETVTDLVAHTKMKTPTAVAEFLINGMRSFEEALEEKFHRLINVSEQVIVEKRYQLESLQNELRFAVSSQVSDNYVLLSRWQERLRQLSTARLKASHEQVQQLSKTLKKVANNRLKNGHQQLENYERYLQLLDPARIMQRGYTLTYVNGKPLQEGDILQKGDRLTTHSQYHLLHSIIESSENKKNG